METETRRLGGTATITCGAGFHLSDERAHVVTCKEDTETAGKWDPNLPVCEGTALLISRFLLTVATYVDVNELLN